LNSAYSTSLIGGSAYFDGTGDYLQLADSTSWDLTGDYTIEMWMYSTATPVSTTFFQIGDTSNYLVMYLASSTKYITTAGSLSITASTALALNTWNHIALVRSGSSTNNTVLYLNGVNVGQATNNTSFAGTASNGVRIGAEYPSNYYFNGYLSGTRLVKGTALYASNFAPPLTPPTAVTNTQLLTNFTNGAIFDNTAKNVLETASGASLSTAQVKYGTTSMAFNGSSDYVVTPSSALVSAWGGDCTIEGWFYTTSIASTPPLWMNSTSNSDGMSGGYVYSDGRVGMGKIGVSDLYSAVGLWSNNRWNHVAYVKAGATAYIFLNGVLVASGTATTYFETSTTKPITLGRNYQNSPNYYTGYIQDFRITKGYARYVANFTPPTSQLQDQ
jgi:hypothetical protein